VTEACSTALQTIISEFRNISPEIASAFVFKKDGEVLASTETVTEDQAKKVSTAIDDISEEADVIGGVETLTIYGVSSQLSVTSMDDCFLAALSSREADEKRVKALTCVVVPTVVRLVNQVSTALPENQLLNIEKPEAKLTEDFEEPEQAEQAEETEQVFEMPEEPTPVEQVVEPLEEPKPMESLPDPLEVDSELIFPKPPVNQFMVEKIGGLLVASNTVRVDKDVVAMWSDLYSDREITQVNVETLEGRTLICKFKPMSKADGNAKGIIKIPEKILRTLNISEGKLVIIKPVILTAREKKS